MSNERAKEILVNALGWISEHIHEEDELIRVCHEHLRMSDDEIKELL